MERRILKIAAILLSLSIVSCKSDPATPPSPTPEPEKENTFNNPVLIESVPDPTVYEGGDGYYYLFYTCGFSDKGLQLYRSKNLVDWEGTGKSPFSDLTVVQLKTISDDHDSPSYSIWAPTVRKVGDYFVMYASIRHLCMVALYSTCPEGPFSFKGGPKVLLDKNVTGLDIGYEDSCVSQELDGQWYMIWGSQGLMYRTKLKDNGMELVDNAKFDHVAGDPKRPTVVYEGAYAYYHDGYWYLFTARGRYSSEDDPYRVVVGRSKTLDGVFVDKEGKKMNEGNATLILEPDTMVTFLGGGHTGEIFVDKLGRNYMFYQRQFRNGKHIRPLFLQQIFWAEDGWPYFENGKTKMKDIKPSL